MHKGIRICVYVRSTDSCYSRTIFAHRLPSTHIHLNSINLEPWTFNAERYVERCTRSGMRVWKRFQLIESFDVLACGTIYAFPRHCGSLVPYCIINVFPTPPTPSQFCSVSQDQCTGILETISRQVNNKHSELAAHRLLSIFKMAEVQVVLPEVSAAALHRTLVRTLAVVMASATVVRWTLMRHAGRGWIPWC